MSPGENGKIGLAKSLGLALKDKLAEVLIVAMFLSVGVYLGRDIGGALVTSLQGVSASLGSISEVVAVFATELRGQQELRAAEHNDLKARFDECKEMGRALGECRREDRR